MRIGFIGAGKAGVTLGKYFSLHGIEITGYYSRHIQSAREAAEFTAADIYERASDLLADSDVLFLTVPDDAIAGCYRELCRSAGSIQGKIFCHASGAMTAEAAFPGIEAAGAYGYSVHPLFAISDRFSAYSQLADVFFTLEGSAGRRDFMLEWLTAAGLTVQSIAAGCKARYHAAAAIVSNQVVALFEEGRRMLEECGFQPEAAERALKPLFLGNALQVAEKGAVRALTGPVQRGDTGTLAKHLAVFENSRDRLLYLLLSRELVKLARAKSADYDDTSIGAFLDEEYRKGIEAAAAELRQAGRKDEAK